MINMLIALFWPLIHLSLSDLRYDQYLFTCYQKPANFTFNFALLHSDSTYIRHIANLGAGGERAANTAQSIYWSCHAPIRTQKGNCGQAGGTTMRNCGPVTTWPKTRSFISGLGYNQALVTRSKSLAVHNRDHGLGFSCNADCSQVSRNCW